MEPLVVFLAVEGDFTRPVLALACSDGLRAFDTDPTVVRRKIWCVQRISHISPVSGRDNVLMPMEEIQGAGVDTRLGMVMDPIPDFYDEGLTKEERHERYKGIHYNVISMEGGKLGVVDPFWI